jgi:hypothetical protein
MNQMQTLMYFAHLGMMAHMNGGSGMSLPGTPTAAMTNSPMAAAAGGMNPMMFSMMNPQQLAAFTATQQQWQGNMAPSTIANIAAAAAVAATAASNPEVSSRCKMLTPPLNLSAVSVNTTTAGQPDQLYSFACNQLLRLNAFVSSCLQADTGYGSNRSNSRPRGAVADRLDRLRRCDKGSRSSSGRMDDCGSPCSGRVDPLLEDFKNNRTRKWEMRVS